MGKGQMVEFPGALNPAREDVKEPAATGRGYLVKPETGRGPGVLLLHAWWGLNDVVRHWADGLADAGFTVLAPDLFGDGTAVTTIEAAQERVSAFESDDDPSRLISGEQVGLGAVDRLVAEAGAPIGVVGFSFGAAYSIWASRKRPEQFAAVVLFYGSGGPIGDGTAPVLGHYAENDPYESAEYIAELESQLRDAGRLVEFHTYPDTSHWFAEPDRPEFVEASAQLAWDRTIDFLRQRLRA